MKAMAACVCNPSTAEEGQRQEDSWGLVVSQPTPNQQAPDSVRDCLKGTRQKVIQEDPRHSPLASTCTCMEHALVSAQESVNTSFVQLIFTHPSP